MNLDQFKNESLAQGSVSKYTPNGNTWKDGGYLGQCVSEINQYLARVFGITAGAWGDAADWANDGNPVRQYFDKVSSPQAGDIGVMGKNYGDGYGHIFIYLSPNTILEQNGRVPLRVSTGSAYANPIAILRRKGSKPQEQDMPLTAGQIDFLYRRGVGRPAQQSDIDANVGKDPGKLIDALSSSKEAADYDDELIYHAYLGYLRRPPEESAVVNARSQGRRKYFNDVQKSDEAAQVTKYYEAGKAGGETPIKLDKGTYRVE